MKWLAKKLGKKISKKRKEHGLTQESLAELTKLHASYIAGVEQGRFYIGLKNTYIISQALNMTMSELLQDLEKKKNS